MASRKKSWNITIKERARKLMAVLIVIIVVAFLLRMKVVAEMVAPLLGMEPEKLQESAGYAYGIGIGVLIIVAGGMVSVPFVATGLILVGATFLILEGVRLWNARGKGDDITLF